MIYKNALITGASSGIGHATAEELASAGLSLLLVARREDRLREIQEDLKKRFAVSVEVAVLDVQDAMAVEGYFKNDPRFQNIDVLVNNAGLAKGTEKLHEANIADWEQMLDTNVKGLLYMTRFVSAQMVKRNFGFIVNLGSVAGRWVYPGGAVYCASKFAVRALSEGLRMDLLGTKVRVTNIEPGMVESEFSKVRFGSEERSKAVYKGMTPLECKDVAETIRWCVERPAHVNIQELVIFPTDQAAIQHVHRQ